MADQAHDGDQRAPGDCRESADDETRLINNAELAEALDCGRVDLQELRSSAMREAARFIVDPREQLEKERLFRRGEQEGEHAVGAWVRLHGLQTEALNGREGVVVEPLTAAGRVGVAIASAGSKAIRPCNLAPVGDDETIKVARIFCQGERGAGVRTWRWPARAIVDRPFEVSPLSQRIGMPLHVTRCEPQRALGAPEDFANQWVGHLMLDPRTGSVPHDWHAMPGPVIVWRADLGDLSADDVCLIVCFIDQLLGRLADKASPFDPDAEVNWEAFEAFKCKELEAHRDSERSQWWEDVNI